MLPITSTPTHTSRNAMYKRNKNKIISIISTSIISIVLLLGIVKRHNMPDINFGILQNPSQIQSFSPQAQQAPSPQIQAPSEGSSSGGGGLLSGFLGKMFGKNAVGTANEAVNQTLSNTPTQQIAQSVMSPSIQSPNVLNASPSSSYPNAVQNSGQIPVNPMIANAPAQLKAGLDQTYNKAPGMQNHADLKATLNGIYGVESGGEQNPYTALGKATKNGDVALGKYQIMSSNVPNWTKQAIGKSMTTKEFLANPEAQEATAAYQVNSLLNKGMSPQDVASVWFTGRPQNKVDPNVKDAYGTTASQYIHKFNDVFNGKHNITSEGQAMHLPPQNITGGEPAPKELTSSPAYTQATQSYDKGMKTGVTKSPIMTVIDYSKPATEPRLSVVNMQTGKVLMQTYVAQGAQGFSNTPGSHQSSLGTFITQNTYDGKHGQSLRINGLDKGVNDNVLKRNVVVHGADYIGNGKQGRSFGCFAVPTKDAPKLINLIKGGTMIYASDGSNKHLSPTIQQQSISSPLQQAQNSPPPQMLSAASPQGVLFAGVPAALTQGQVLNPMMDSFNPPT